MKSNISTLFFVSLSLLFFTNNDLIAADIIVNPGDNLQQVINSAQGGDVIIVNGGNYPGTIHIQNRTFTEANPLIIKNGNGTPHITGSGSHSGGTTFRITNCSFIAVDGFMFSNSLYGCFITLSDHIIIQNCEITNTGQEGLHANEGVEYIDVIGCEIHHTGRRVNFEGWGEGIYIGGAQQMNRYIYIEGNEIYECGFGEGINIKASDSEMVTVKNNHIHDVHPGKSTTPNAQWNGGAIGVSHHFVNTDRLIWIEENLIENISGGQTSDSGIMSQQSDTRIVNNTIRNCDDRGLYFNDYISDHPCWNFGNTFSNNGVNVFKAAGAQVFTSNPGLSPFVPQTWYNQVDSQEPPPADNGDNIALNKPVNVSAQQTDSEGLKAVDGSRNELDRWSAEFFPQSIEIDLLGTYLLDRIDVFPLQNRAYQYTVEAMTAGGSYQQIINRSNNNTGAAVITDLLADVPASKVRFTFTGAAVYTGDWTSIREIEIFGEETNETTGPTEPTEPIEPSDLLLETEGDIFLSKINSGIILISQNGTCFKMKVDDAGQFTSEAVECPE